jgi:tRNA G18 (ribose-2'-O)-methylase SpoU
MSLMRGYFGIGVERLSKPVNAANLFRSAHAFGASFVFTIAATYAAHEAALDTSRAIENLPYYHWDSLSQMDLPKGCALVGIELTEDAVELPSFKHPAKAAYVLGRERGALSPALMGRCDHVVKIPARFCVNVAVAGAIVMYDRMLTLGRYPPRPLMPGGPAGKAANHRWGAPIARKSEDGD